MNATEGGEVEGGARKGGNSAVGDADGDNQGNESRRLIALKQAQRDRHYYSPVRGERFRS